MTYAKALTAFCRFKLAFSYGKCPAPKHLLQDFELLVPSQFVELSSLTPVTVTASLLYPSRWLPFPELVHMPLLSPDLALTVVFIALQNYSVQRNRSHKASLRKVTNLQVLANLHSSASYSATVSRKADYVCRNAILIGFNL